jgi:hypothetical protein
MNYSETIKLIADILSLSVCSKRKPSLESQLRNDMIVWERLVQVSTEHLVLPALYIRLKQAKLIDLLPQELQVYMEHITSLNRSRNQQNIEQVEELNALLLDNNIQPIYLKGTAHLLEGLYFDIGERMVGDIDLLVAPAGMEKAADLLMKNGYSPMSEYSSDDYVRTKHYPRMTHPDKVFAVEIHKDVIQKVSHRQLDYAHINSSKRTVNGYYLPSYADLVLHNSMNTQLNDQGFLLMSINLRQKYDFLLLSQYEKPIDVIENFNFHKMRLQSYLVKSAFLFPEQNALVYPKTVWTYWVELLMSLKLKLPKSLKVITGINFVLYRIYRDVNLAIEYLPNHKKRSRILKYVLNSEKRSIYFQNIYNRLKSM